MAVGFDFDDLGRVCVAMGVGRDGMEFDRDDRRRIALEKNCILLIVYMIWRWALLILLLGLTSGCDRGMTTRYRLRFGCVEMMCLLACL